MDEEREVLGVSTGCRTADEPLSAANPAHLDARVRECGPPQPADVDVMG